MFLKILQVSQKTQDSDTAAFLLSFKNKIIKKETLAQGFYGEFCEISENTFFTEHLQWLLLNQVANGNQHNKRVHKNWSQTHL